MTIARADVKLMKSERLTDNEDGGGRMVGYEVEDGVANNLFPDISRLDRVYGRVSMRKAFLSVNTANSDMYYGAHAIVSNPPADDSVHTLLFTTKSPSDERANAQDGVESYLVKSYKTTLKLLGDHLAGQATITCFQDLKAELPSIGDVLVLVQGITEQFVRIVDLKAKETTFSYDNGQGGVGSFVANRITLEINQLLTSDFTGNEPNPTASPVTAIYTCTVANAARYYGVDTLEDPAHVGAKQIKATTIFKPIVPSTNRENVILDSFPFVADDNIIAIGADNSYSKSLGTSVATGKTFYAGVGIFPGSLRITVGTTLYKDRGGELVPSNPANDIGVTGTVEYTTGKIFVTGGASNLAVSVVCTPGANMSGERITDYKEITLAELAFTYIFTVAESCKQLPARGTVTADYLSFGKWYRLYDNGTGSLVGKVSGVGAGTVDYDTGTISVTCAALPDIGSHIIISFGPKGGVAALSTPGYTPAPQEVHFPEQHILAGSISLSWKKADGTTVTAADNGNGVISGAGTGEAMYFPMLYDIAGIPKSNFAGVRLYPTLKPDLATPITVTYHEAAGSVVGGNLNQPELNGSIEPLTFSLEKTNIRAGSVRMSVLINRPYGFYYGWDSSGSYKCWATVYDDGAGNLVMSYDYWNYGFGFYRVYRPQQVGTVNYVTGSVTLDIHLTNVTVQWYGINSGFYSRQELATGLQTYAGQLYYNCIADNVDAGVKSISVPWTAPQFIFTNFSRDILPTSMRFSVGGTLVYDKPGGLLQYNISASTGVGTAAGTVDYETGVVTLTDYSLFSAVTALSAGFSCLGAVTKDGMDYPIKKAVFRTIGAPLVPGSVSVRAFDFDTAVDLNLAVDEFGLITSPVDPTLTGKVSFDTGVISLVCGTKSIYAPKVSYNAIYLQNLPLDPDLLGLDPTKLPLNGLVPIFRKADVIVVHHTATYQCAEPAVGATYNVGRTRLALVEIYDANDAVVSSSKYTAGLDAGTVTFVDPLTGVVEPLRILHRIEDMLLATEVYINGKIETAGAISHEFPAVETQVSSALLFGDLSSRVLKLFSQATWTGTWSDERIGNNTTGQYNDLQYPIAVKNEESIEERWSIVFTSATNFTINGETLGQLGTGNTGANCAPLNALTGKPYFTIPFNGWGTGWATGNVLRFNTQAASAPFWLIRTTLAGPVEEPVDKFVLQLRGDAN